MGKQIHYLGQKVDPQGAFRQTKSVLGLVCPSPYIDGLCSPTRFFVVTELYLSSLLAAIIMIVCDLIQSKKSFHIYVIVCSFRDCVCWLRCVVVNAMRVCSVLPRLLIYVVVRSDCVEYVDL